MTAAARARLLRHGPSADQRNDAMAGAAASSPGTGRRPSDSLLAKPDRAGLPPAAVVNGAGHGRCGVVRGCPLGTGQDCCKWHASGTAGEDDTRSSGQQQSPAPPEGEANRLFTTCLVGKSPKAA